MADSINNEVDLYSQITKEITNVFNKGKETYVAIISIMEEIPKILAIKHGYPAWHPLHNKNKGKHNAHTSNQVTGENSTIK